MVGSLRMTTCIVPVGRKVDTGIAIEKAARHQLEAGEDAGLNRKIFRPNLIVKPKNMPEDNVGVRDVPVLLDEVRNTPGAIGVIRPGRLRRCRIQPIRL